MSIVHDQSVHAARIAVTAACRVTRQVQQRLEEAGEITKDDRSPVTVADFAAQAVVAHELEEALGGSLRIVGEESAGVLRQNDHAVVRRQVVRAVQPVWPGATEDEVLGAIDACNHDGSGPSYWTLDPVDGTKGFLRGGQYAVSLGWIESGKVRLGLMGCPNLSPDFERDFGTPDPVGLIYGAQAEAGAWQAPADDAEADPVAVSLVDAAPCARIRVCESVESAHTKQDDTARIVDHLGGGGTPARLDSQAKYAVVARGQADAYLRLPTRPGYVEKIWDHAAGMLVAAEAGAIVTDVLGKPLDFSHGSLLEANRGVICASPAFHGLILEAISALDLSWPGT